MAPRGGGGGGGGQRTYGFPIYCAAWLPLAHILKPGAAGADADADASSSGSVPPPPMALLGGGGGEGRSGVPNKLVVAALDLAAAGEAGPALSAVPVFEAGTEEQVPYRMAVHPRGDGALVAFPNGCRLYRWKTQEGEEPQKLALQFDEEALVELKDIGLQLAVSFSVEGSILAIGGDGHLRVFKWPAMESVLTEADTKTSIKDLNFSSDEKFLAVNRSSGPCRVWDLQSSEVVANLGREAGEIFGFCRFCTKADNCHILFVTAMQGDYGKIISWNTTSWTRIGSKKITREAISAFAVSPDGAVLAIGTIEGSIIVLGSKNMRTLVTVKKAHLGIVTTLAFSQDSRTLLSTSFDSTARVTSVRSPKSNGPSIWPMILAIILAILVYCYMQHKEDLLAMLQH
ncbi:hypothetical protein ACP70R_035152 [Stipagrostis hirtigluma subsp. patula]